MPRAIDEDLEKSKQGLVVILPESQGAAAEDLPGFMYVMFPKCEARVCKNSGNPFPESKGLPHTNVVGVDGTLLFDGSPSADAKGIDKAIAQELEKVQKGWGPTPEAKKFRALLFGKQSYVEAKKVLDAGGDGIDATLKTQLSGELDKARTTRVKAATFLLDAGQVAKARDAIKKLEAGCKGNPDWEQEVAALTQKLESPEMQKEAAADKKVNDAVTKLRTKAMKGPEAVKAFAALGKSLGDTKSAARAKEIAAGLEKNANAMR